jgi:hypothetical protein
MPKPSDTGRCLDAVRRWFLAEGYPRRADRLPNRADVAWSWGAPIADTWELAGLHKKPTRNLDNCQHWKARPDSAAKST